MLNAILQRLLNNDFSALNDIETNVFINNITLGLLEKSQWDNKDISNADIILKISNIAYNNTSKTVLPLDDGIYDQLLVIYSKYNPNYQVGSYNTDIYDELSNENTLRVMCHVLEDRNKYIYVNNIFDNLVDVPRGIPMCHVELPPITKRLINTTHKYPELVGTLDKCKFVLNEDARIAEVYDKPGIQIFERDFISKCISSGIIRSDEVFEMVMELKYDGISVEAEVRDGVIISALSRGDTADNIATDLTPIFGGYRFHMAHTLPEEARGITFGIKFEAIITNNNLHKLSEIRNKKYKNCRNAIIGLCGASDANIYVDYITLIPLATSLDVDRVSELEFLNKYFNSGEYNRYVVARGNYVEMLFYVNEFLKSAEYVRPVLGYMIDGIVVSFTDKDKITKLGRINSVNKYSMAIKFNPKNNRTIFLGYTYSIGKSGVVIPMAHFKPCEFIGGIHSKQTIHSLARFNELGLRYGDEIDISYVNEVITYITKPDTEHNRNNTNPMVEFITHCPSCGSELIISDSGKSAYCNNPNCHERLIMRMVDMIDRLGVKDFSEETIRILDITSFMKLMNLSYDDVICLGPNDGPRLLSYIEEIKNNNLIDYKIMSALGFKDMADSTWKIILDKFTIKELYDSYLNSDEVLRTTLTGINGIGPKTIDSIVNGFSLYRDDIEYILNKFNIINYKGSVGNKPRLSLSGFRDADVISLLKDNGFDVEDTYSVTKNTSCLIVSNKNIQSSKVTKANKYGIPIMTLQEFLDHHGIHL